jgi:serine/threonine protein kinase
MPVRLVSQEEPLPGYRLVERLGRGGFGEVWKVEAPGGLMKAMKFVFGDLEASEEAGRPAEQELKALHRVKTIRHPYILSLERFDIIDGQLIIVMELADRNLWDRFRQCRAEGHQGIPREELLRYMEETAEALDLMNDQYKIQHLDVKPQNIFLVHNRVKVADFGLAKAFEGARATVTGGVTPVYAAPETFEGSISRFTDQYSLGIVYQELLTGTRPFNGQTTRQLLLQHLNGIPDLSSLPHTDRAAVERALSKDPNTRWPSCTELVAALRQAGAAPTAVSPEPTGVDSVLRTRMDTPRPGELPPPPSSPVSPPARSAPRPPGSGVIGFPMRSLANTPGPGSAGLVTPRLVTPQAAAGSGVIPAQTLQRPQVFQTGRMSSLGIAPPEKDGDGVLFPALVVAIGQTGLEVLRRFRQMIRDRYGAPDALPTVRFLYLDTDPDAAAAATSDPDPLPPKEVVVARLNRPAHYLQSGGVPQVETWMPPGLLYQLPKNPGPAAGVRAFGRLALCDNYRVVAQRIRQEIETFLTDDPLDKSGEQTGLGVRTNRPRAYVLAGLAGGTGSGMLVDLAFVLKHELRAVGYRKPETVGVLFVPPADRASQKPAALANTYAALAEVRHFASGVRYQHRFDPAEAPVTDADGPFARHIVFELPKAAKERDRARVFGLAARGLFTELFSTAGQVTDEVRASVPATGDVAEPVASVFGLHRLTWPRAELLTAATRRFSQRLLLRWAAKETGPLVGVIRQWLDDQWPAHKLDPRSIRHRFDQVVRDVLRDDPEIVFDGAIHSLRAGGNRVDPEAACEVLDQLIKLVGKPPEENDPAGTLDGPLREAQKTFAKDAEKAVATMAVQFIELPQYRLPGAEEALNQLGDRVKETIADLEAVRRDQAREVREAFVKLFHAIGGLGTTGGLAAITGRRSSLSHEVLDTLRAYPLKRLRLAETDAVLGFYRTLAGGLPEVLRDINYCRTRLGEMVQMLADQATPAADPAATTVILPPGCKTLDDAADEFIRGLAPEDLLAFDQALQKDVAKKFRAVARVCTKAGREAEFVALVTAQARAFLDARLERADPAAALDRYHDDPVAVRKLLAAGYEKACPDLTAVAGPVPAEATILGAPFGEAGDWVREAAADACPGVDFVPAVVEDDILIWREYPKVGLITLPQMAAAAREAYQTADQSPHTRADIAWAGG